MHATLSDALIVMTAATSHSEKTAAAERRAPSPSCVRSFDCNSIILTRSSSNIGWYEATSHTVDPERLVH